MDLGKVTVFSGSPQQQSSPTLPLEEPTVALFQNGPAQCCLLLNFLTLPVPGAALLALN